MTTSPFFEGYADGLADRASLADRIDKPRDRERYADGHRIGTEDRLAGALEPIEPLS